ncbi:MAG: hypothetical protein NC218_06650 [Acetobacter sp.]|nr:hypothetical protein [Acetobacter sp.]
MSKSWKIFAMVMVCLLVGVGGGVFLRQNQGMIFGERVVIRVGNVKAEMDYDLAAAIDYLAYKMEQNGATVLGITYSGELYPERFDEADVNVYVRGYIPFYDVRLDENSKNIYYMHRVQGFHKEELRGFDKYLFSQREVLSQMEKEVAAAYLEGGAVPHSRLEPSYEYDILYIFEEDKNGFYHFISSQFKAKVLSGMEFAALTNEEKETVLSKAKLVVYNMMVSEENDVADYDDEYVAYAVYDIMSYGRPLVTNRRQGLEERFSGTMWLYNNDFNSQAMAVMQALSLADTVRENAAAAARKQLLGEGSYK